MTCVTSMIIDNETQLGHADIFFLLSHSISLTSVTYSTDDLVVSEHLASNT